MVSAHASSAATAGRPATSGWDEPAAGAEAPGNDRPAGGAAEDAATTGEPASDACLRAYHREAAGRLALAALCQRHGPLS